MTQYRELIADSRFILRIILNFMIISATSGIMLVAQDYKARIISSVPHDSKFINYGPCFLNDTLQIKFFIKNEGAKSLLMTEGIPTIYLGLSPNDATLNQFTLFRRFTPLPKTYLPDESDTLRINFLAGDTLVSRTGWHEALLGLSLVPSDNPGSGPISKIDTFFLRVKKTPYFVAAYDDVISFDSVYINPNIKLERKWRVKNVWNEDQPIINLEKRLITQPVTNSEFFVDDIPSGIDIYPDSTIIVNVAYHPLNRGRDSMFLKLNYYPLRSIFPDSIDFAWAALRGIGVEQDLRITNSDFNWNIDTIDLGNVNVSDSLIFNVQIKNFGNMPFGLIDQSILNWSDNNVNNNFRILSKFQRSGNHLALDATDSLRIVFKPQGQGIYLARLKFESDIFNRNISGVQPDKRYVYYYIKANVISPSIVTNFKEVDFGNIVVNSSCLSQRDTTITVYNAGNTDLIISNIHFNPDYPNNYFYVNESQFIVPPSGSKQITVSFYGLSGDFDSFESVMIFETNQTGNSKYYEILLKAKSVPPISAYLSIPAGLKSKPGTNIEVPVILQGVDKTPVQLARHFKTSIVYNRTLIEFVSTRTIGTALEGAFNSGDLFENPLNNELYLDFSSPSNNYFMNKDTLLVLKFKTYLGNSPATEISIVEPKFSDGVCEDIFTLNTSNGSYYTDSVCGVELKALPQSNGKFEFIVVQERIDSDYKLQFQLPYETNVELIIFDTFGNKIIDIVNSRFGSGIYEYRADISFMKTGTYFAVLRTPAYQSIKPVVIVR